MFTRASAFAGDNNRNSSSSVHGHLDAVLSNTQVPRQSFAVVVDGYSRPGVPVLREMIARDIESSRHVLLITALYRPEDLLPPWLTSSSKISVLDLSERIEGYGDAAIDVQEVQEWVERSLPGQIYIDSLPHLCASSASSSSSSSKLTVLRLVRTLLDRLSSTGAPSRLTLLLPDTSPLLRDLTRTNFSSTLTCLRLHAPTVLNRLAEEHLTKPPEDGDLAKPGNRTWSLLQRVEETWDDLADEGSTDWAVGGGGGGGGALVELTVRKAHGGSTKGMTRSLEALLMAEDRRSASVGRRNRVVGRRWQDMPGLGLSSVKDTSSAEVAMGQTDAAAGGAQATSAPVQQKQGDASMAAAASQPHPSQADTSFNLGLTAQQLASRASVPIPYVFDGSTRSASTAATGGGGAPVIHFEPGSEDDVDEDDPDEDLDF